MYLHCTIYAGDSDASSDPTQMDIAAHAVATAAGGFDHCCVVTQDGKLSVFGPGYRPTDGLLMSLEVPSPVKQVSCGEHHSLILTEGGDCYAFGSNREVQLGSPSAGSESTKPILVAGPGAGTDPIAAIAAGARHSVALTASGSILSWGCSLHGECGTGAIVPSVPTPTVVSALGPLKFVAIGAGMGHTLCLSETGDVYSWGSNDQGQLGDGTTVSSLNPKLIESLGAGDDPVVKIAVGGRHSVALTKSGKAFSWGFGKFGQLGNGVFESVSSPKEMVTSEKVVDVAAGWWHTVVITA
jgi:alpha-tubulin suppressor-like RCC1 family protein